VARLSDLIREQASHQKSGVTHTSHTGASALSSCRSWIASTRQELYRIKEAVHANKIPDVTRCASPAEQLVNLLHQSDNALHVAILSTKVGIGLQYREQDLERLALAGLLHDLGMWTVPELLITKQGALTEEERDLIRAHPERGRRILTGQGSVFEWVASICAQEHERWDGSGYPCRLKHKQIAEPAQVIGIVDSLDAMVTTRPYRMNNSPHDVIRELLLHGKALFSLPVLKAIGDQITLYPVGTEVRLNTGESGTVKRTNPRYPLRPVVEISKFGEPSDMDLSQNMSAHIVGVVHARMAS
jgi:HD-GYP domain-containing protein (c-di-GMP phosphodiesterase class II)